MGKYLLAYITMMVVSFLILFLAGCLIGAIATPFINPHDIESSILRYGIVFQILFIVINFFCFRYSVQRFIEETKD